MVYKALLAKQGLLGERLQVKENICIIVKDGIIEIFWIKKHMKGRSLKAVKKQT
ncbi:MAG: hypothetical protein ACLSFC_15440 [Enterocloster bolteae]